MAAKKKRSSRHSRSSRRRGNVRAARSHARLPWPTYSARLNEELLRLDVGKPDVVRNEFSDSVGAFYSKGETPRQLAERLVRSMWGQAELKQRKRMRD